MIRIKRLTNADLPLLGGSALAVELLNRRFLLREPPTKSSRVFEGELVEWLDEHCNDLYYFVRDNDNYYRWMLCFSTDKDMVFFALWYDQDD